MKAIKWTTLCAVLVVALVGCARKPYMPAIQVRNVDLAYKSVFIKSVETGPTLDQVIPDENHRYFLDRVMELSGGYEAYTTRSFADYFKSNRILAETERSADFIANIIIEENLIAEGSGGMTYQTGVRYVLTDGQTGEEVFNQKVETAELVTYEIAWGELIGSAVGRALTGNVAPVPVGPTAGDRRKTSESAFRQAIESNIHKALPLIMDFLNDPFPPLEPVASAVEAGA